MALGDRGQHVMRCASCTLFTSQNFSTLPSGPIRYVSRFANEFVPIVIVGTP